MSRRDERRAYENDVFYEAWRRGLDPDRAAHPDRVENHYWDGLSPHQSVDRYERQMAAQREERAIEEQYEQRRAEQEQWEREQQEGGAP